MPRHQWPRRPIDITSEFERRGSGRGECSALIMWAVYNVEGLHYLDDLDDLHQKEAPPSSLHSPNTVNIAHIRWATTTAITSLDLCAAALGRHFCGWTKSQEFDLAYLDPSRRHPDIPARRATLP